MVTYYNDLGVPFALPSFGDDQVDAIANIASPQLLDSDLLLSICKEGQASFRRDNDRLRSRLFVSPGILAFGIHVETVPSMLDRRDSIPFLHQLRNQALDQGRLAAIGPPHEAQDGSDVTCHYDPQLPNTWTFTTSRGFSFSTSTGMSMSPFALTIEVRMPDPWGPVVRTINIPRSIQRMPRRK